MDNQLTFHPQNLISLRAVFGGLVLGVVLLLPVMAIAGQDNMPTVLSNILFWLGFLAGWLGNAFIPLYCSDCGKRIKSGYNVCHHCGLHNS